jgi:CO/xanthine dehydrogenase FAD-binding subunit
VTFPPAQFFQAPKTENDRETALRSNEILTAITIPLRDAKSFRNATYEVRHRHGLDWPYVTASVAFQTQDGVISNPQIVLGHVRRNTMGCDERQRRPSRDRKLTRRPRNVAGDAAADGAKPLSGNATRSNW